LTHLPWFDGSAGAEGLLSYSMTSIILFLAQQSPPSGAQPSMLTTLLPFLFMGVIFYFMLIRPQQKRQKQHQQLLAALKTGDKVVTASGIHGMIANVKERTFLLKVADNVKIEIDKSAIAGVEQQSQASDSTAKPA
jgi:preprotein translocase subunit YajC